MLVARVTHEHPGWSIADVADYLGEATNTVRRWRDGGGWNPKTVAEAGAWLGYTPDELGITEPRAVRAAARILDLTTRAPEWAVEHHAELVARLDALAKLVRDECEHVHVLETEIKHLRKA